MRSWQHAVGVVAEWLVTSGRLAEDRLPLQVGDIVRGVHWEPVHSDGARFNRSHDFDAPSGRRVYVHTHGTYRTSLYYIRCMLESWRGPRAECRHQDRMSASATAAETGMRQSTSSTARDAPEVKTPRVWR